MNRIVLLFFFVVITNQVINSSVNGDSYNDLDDQAQYTSTFQQRLKMLPVKVLLQVMKTKNGLSNGIAKTMQLNSTRRIMEGVQESSGALFGLLKDGLGDLTTLVFGI